MGLHPVSVTEIVSLIKENLEGGFGRLVVEGEVSNLLRSAVGHWYFTLSDGESSLQAALFKSDALRNPLMRTLKDGDKLICQGRLGVYARRGTFQLICKSVHPAGKGDLKAKFEDLKAKLASEGLFDRERKRPIPPLPGKVAVISAEKGAALADFLKIYRRRSLWMDVTVVPATVQGEKAPVDLIRALRLAAQRDYEVIVLARGGGSLEDLAAFNDEALARAIGECGIPVVSAVGHEVDFTIADFVSDLRAETPSAAAQILTESQTKIHARLASAQKTLGLMMSEILGRYRHRVAARHPRALLGLIEGKLGAFRSRLETCRRLHHPSEIFRFHEVDFFLDELVRRGLTRIEDQRDRHHHRLERSWDLLRAFDIREVLKRGFSYLSVESKIISSRSDFDKVAPSTPIHIDFWDGRAVFKKKKTDGS
ncbi:MAG: exodeoxyribonuclease VII large subunit [Bacteriovoracales bacterium]|nr:exodeoxyribonuclease VII large subunit [Bacteriovoracales bacterium]